MDRSVDWIKLFGKTSDGDQRQVEAGMMESSPDQWTNGMI